MAHQSNIRSLFVALATFLIFIIIGVYEAVATRSAVGKVLSLSLLFVAVIIVLILVFKEKFFR